MRYPESKERSAELLRAALARMGQHDAAFNPITFAVWYEVVAGGNARLEKALAECLQTEPRLGDGTIRRLHHDCVEAADSAALRELSDDFQRVMESVAQSADRTGERAGVFHQQLDGLSNALRGDESQLASRLPPRLNETLTGVASMKTAARELQQQVAASRHEIDRLRDDLTRAREEALLDPLTGILNRGGFDRRLAELLTRPAAPGTAHCLVLIDIDHFKQVNDSHGHVVGDRVIAALGLRLSNAVADREAIAARYGGEEFAILLPQSTPAEAATLAESVRAKVGAMRLRNRQTQEVLLTVTVSAGVAALRAGDDAAGLIARADAALYRSKQGGRDRVTLDQSR